MSDDLVKRLVELDVYDDCNIANLVNEAADRIEKLENQFKLYFHAFNKAASRIEQLEAALRQYECSMCELSDGHEACGKLRDDECAGCLARKTLEGI